MTDRFIYFDNAATTRPTREVCDAVLAAMRERYGNPSSLHGKGREAERLVDESREMVARAMGVDPQGVIFTSGGTEANNMAFAGYLRRGPRGRANRVLTTETEHPSILGPCDEARNAGWEVGFLSVDGDGIINLNELESKIDDRVSMIALTHVNSETGAIQPIKDIGSLCGKLCPNAHLHLDCVQSFGKLPLSPRGYGADIAGVGVGISVSVSAHKIHGTKGAGAIYFSAPARVLPVLYGGGQERGLRSGTENTPAIAGFGIAARDAASGLESYAARVAGLKRHMLDSLDKAGVGYIRISSETLSSPYILATSFPGIRAETMVNYLSGRGVYISAGSACSSRRADKTGSRALAAMGVKPTIIESAVRFSFSRFNTNSEVESAVDTIKAALTELRGKCKK